MILAAICVVPRQSFAQSPELSFWRDPSLTTCPTEARFRQILSRHGLSFAVAPDEARTVYPTPTRVTVRYAPSARRGHVRIDVALYAGTAPQTFFVDVNERDCGTLPSALIVRLNYNTQPIHPVGPTIPAPVPAPSRPPEATPPPTNVVREPASRPALRASVAARPPPRTPRSSIAFGVHAGGGATVLAQPDVEPDLVLGVSLVGTHWQVRAQALAGVRYTVERRGVRWSSQRWMGDLVGCYLAEWVGVCGGALLGIARVQAEGNVVDGAESTDVSLVLRALVDHRIVGRLRFWGTVDLVSQLIAPRVVAPDPRGGVELWSSTGWGISAALGLGLRLG